MPLAAVASIWHLCEPDLGRSERYLPTEDENRKILNAAKDEGEMPYKLDATAI